MSESPSFVNISLWFSLSGVIAQNKLLEEPGLSSICGSKRITNLLGGDLSQDWILDVVCPAEFLQQFNFGSKFQHLESLVSPI